MFIYFLTTSRISTIEAFIFYLNSFIICVALLYHYCTITVPLLYHYCTITYHYYTIILPLLYHYCTISVPNTVKVRQKRQ